MNSAKQYSSAISRRRTLSVAAALAVAAIACVAFVAVKEDGVTQRNTEESYAVELSQLLKEANRGFAKVRVLKGELTRTRKRSHAAMLKMRKLNRALNSFTRRLSHAKDKVDSLTRQVNADHSEISRARGMEPPLDVDRAHLQAVRRIITQLQAKEIKLRHSMHEQQLQASIQTKKRREELRRAARMSRRAKKLLKQANALRSDSQGALDSEGLNSSESDDGSISSLEQARKLEHKSSRLEQRAMNLRMDAEVIGSNDHGLRWDKEQWRSIRRKIRHKRIAEDTWNNAVSNDLATARRMRNRLTAASQDLREAETSLRSAAEKKGDLRGKVSKLRASLRSLRREHSTLHSKLQDLQDDINRTQRAAQEALAEHVHSG